MSAVVYTAREARARFAELLRRVRNGETVAVSYRGAPVAEIRRPAEAQARPPVEKAAPGQAISPDEEAAWQTRPPDEDGAPGQGVPDPMDFDFPPAAKDEAELEARLADMRRRGVLIPSNQPKRPFKPVCVVPGALERFLAERD